MSTQNSAVQAATANAVTDVQTAVGMPAIATMDDMTKAVEAGKELGPISQMQVGTINLKTEYLSFDVQGTVVRRIFLGFQLRQSVDPSTGEEKGVLPAAMLYDPETETVNVCMQTVLVGVLNEVGYPKGAALQITYKGDKKGKNGLKYQDFDVRALIPPAGNN